jgi:hypothetical protein
MLKTKIKITILSLEKDFGAYDKLTYKLEYDYNTFKHSILITNYERDKIYDNVLKHHRDDLRMSQIKINSIIINENLAKG